MRPRHKAAEYAAVRDWLFDHLQRASMRPRHKAAEYGEHKYGNPLGITSFNEAAA